MTREPDRCPANLAPKRQHGGAMPQAGAPTRAASSEGSGGLQWQVQYRSRPRPAGLSP